MGNIQSKLVKSQLGRGNDNVLKIAVNIIVNLCQNLNAHMLIGVLGPMCAHVSTQWSFNPQ